MTSVADILVRGLGLPPLPVSSRQPPPGTRCVVTGIAIETGYLVMDITTDATNEFQDTFRGQPTGWVSPAVARAFRQDHNLGARLIFEDGTHYHPLISAESVTLPENAGRPCWSGLVRDVWRSRAGQNVLCLLTTDFKRRLWPRARAGPLGENTPVYLHDSGLSVSASVQVSWPKMLNVLSLLETVYAAGFAKASLNSNLFSDLKRVRQVGFPQAQEWEAALAAFRSTWEFSFALLIAQKPLIEKPLTQEKP